jgi:hypothetical protein
MRPVRTAGALAARVVGYGGRRGLVTRTLRWRSPAGHGTRPADVPAPAPGRRRRATTALATAPLAFGDTRE